MLGLNDEEYGDTVLRQAPNNEFVKEELKMHPMMGGSFVTSNHMRASALQNPFMRSIM